MNRLSDFYVFVSQTPFSSTDPDVTRAQPEVWSYHVQGAPSPDLLLSVGRAGRYVRIQLAGTNYLTLAEVEVFGEAVTSS
jgi:alpha-L-fucosidase 2